MLLCVGMCRAITLFGKWTARPLSAWTVAPETTLTPSLLATRSFLGEQAESTRAPTSILGSHFNGINSDSLFFYFNLPCCVLHVVYVLARTFFLSCFITHSFQRAGVYVHSVILISPSSHLQTFNLCDDDDCKCPPAYLRYMFYCTIKWMMYHLGNTAKVRKH
jgi:hypothetical protein